ncbi:unnamed protein product [Lampetra planeri]
MGRCSSPRLLGLSRELQAATLPARTWHPHAGRILAPAPRSSGSSGGVAGAEGREAAAAGDAGRAAATPAAAAGGADNMGRKSARSREKKQRRQEERAALAAAQARVRAANQLQDPLASWPLFQKYDRNGMNVQIECRRVVDLDSATLDWAFSLTKENMQALYEQSEWGWKEREKQEEMRDERAWYLLARDGAGAPLGFSHFRFDTDWGEEILYCYEIQLEGRARRRGLGKFLMQVLQLIANSTEMKKVVLTVFKHNEGAYRFFKHTLQYQLDETSPGYGSGCCGNGAGDGGGSGGGGDGDGCSYDVLSRRTKHGQRSPCCAHPHTAHGECGSCCH